MKKQSLQPGLISKVIIEIAKQKEDKIPSDLLVQVRKALRAVLRSKDYTFDASSLLKVIDKHPETAHRTLDLLCPMSDYERLMKLFNYKQVLDNIERYVKRHHHYDDDDGIDYQIRTTIEKDMRLLKNALKEFLGDEREIKYWGKKVNWTKNVTIPTPIIIRGNPDDKAQEQENSSLEESSLILLDHNDEIQEVILQVLETETPNRFLFTIRLEPNQKMKEERARILLHNYTSKGGYSTRSNAIEIPLHIEDRGNGVDVYSVSERSIIPGKASRWYLHADLNEIGYRKMNSVEKMIEKIRSDVSTPEEERRELVSQNQTVRKKVINKRQYQMLTVRIKGLLLYSLVESDHKVFNEVIENISKCNRNDAEDFDPYYNEKIWVPFQNVNHLDQVRRMDFPFLLDYYKFSHVLPPNFAFDVLKRIAEEFQSRLETISPSTLKFEVTSRFFDYIKEFFWRGLSIRFPKIYDVDDKEFSILSNYHSTIGSYVRRRQKMNSALEDQIWGKEISYNRLREKTLQK